MHAFDILAEAKIRQWEQEVREGTAKAPQSGQSVGLASSEPLEKKLYQEIRTLLVESYLRPEPERARMRQQARDLHVQLSARLEKSGYNIMSRMFCDAIQALAAQAQALRDDPARLRQLLDELQAELD